MAYTTINKPNLHFNTVTYVADDTSPRTLTGFGHQPDFVWVKHRGSGSVSHTFVDRVRGGDKMLASNGVGAEDTKSHGEITSWNADGITVADGTNGTYPRLYFNDFDPFGASVGGNYVAWSWKANGAGVANTAGTISSTVSANTTAGFSIVTYTSPNSTSDQTVGHGLGAIPSFIITKNLDVGYNWDIHHKNLSSGYGLTFTSDAQRAGVFGSMTSTTFGTKQSYTHNSTNRYIAYCFTDIKGFSKFGSYVGNGNANGTFVYTGFKPAYLMIKNRDQGAGYGFWCIWDNKRNTNNPENIYLTANVADADNAGDTGGVDFLSNGFKIRNAYDYSNGSGINYIYMAFAEQPLVATNNVPATAR
jgi:hypothetical protein